MSAAADRAYDEIRGRILSGDLAPGTRLREVVLAAEAGVSRTPVREALRRLSAEGLAVVLPRRGAIVSDWSPTDLDEIFELRVLLEGVGAGLAAQKINQSSIDELADLAEQIDRLRIRRTPRDLEKITEMNSRFHLMVARSSGNQRLVALLSHLIEAPLVARTFSRYSDEELARSAAHHLELVAALRAHSRDWAESVMRTHLYAARSVLTPPTDSSAGTAAESQ